MDVFIMDVFGIPGTSHPASFIGKIELLSYSHGVASQANGFDVTSRRPIFQDFAVTKRLDTTSPVLNLACVYGQNQGEVKITWSRKEQEVVTPVMVYELSDVFISTISTSGGGDGAPMEALALEYSKIRWTFIPPKGAGEPITRGWDLPNNTPL